MKLNYAYLLFALAVVFTAQACSNEEPPEFVSVEPDFGSSGQLIILKGENIGEIRELLFNGEPIQFNTAYNSDVALLFRIPMGTPLGQTTVTVRTDGGSFEFPFLVSEEPPVIQTVEPRNGDPGDIVTITGENFFDSPLDVWFRTPTVLEETEDGQVLDSVRAEVVYVSETRDTLRVIVPEGIASGRVVVEANGGTANSPLRFLTFERILIADFDGNGLHGDFDTWLARGAFDQVSDDSYLQNDFPAPIDGNYLQLSGRNTRGSAYIGQIQTPPGADTLGIESIARNTFIEFDVNSGGRAATYLAVAAQQVGGRGDYSFTVRLPDEAGWSTVRVPMGSIRNADGFIVDPGQVNVFKFVLLDDDTDGRLKEANIDNLRVASQQ